MPGGRFSAVSVAKAQQVGVRVSIIFQGFASLGCVSLLLMIPVAKLQQLQREQINLNSLDITQRVPGVSFAHT